MARPLAGLLILAGLAAAQQAAPRLDAVDAAIRERRIALTGDLGLPPLAPLTADSPLDSMYFADRVPVPQEQPPAGPEGGPGQMFTGFIPAGPDGTGTDKAESFQYQVPGSYDPEGPPLPMVIAYHGFGQSAKSVATSSIIDEVCNIHGWFYMAPTGIDDQLYGSPISQQNTSAAIQWVLDNFNVDPDRLYMVGFSMGGGVVCNYVARHRDPHGIMIAALGVVSGTMDWVLEYNMGNSAIKDLLINPYNFGGTPTQEPFAYEQSSTLHFQPDSYPPLPGVLQLPLSMGQNLGSTPTYVTWDLGDPTTGVASEQPVLLGVLAGLGGVFESHPVTGVSPPHSWLVLDEVGLFAFFEGKAVNRAPLAFEGLYDGSTQVSWAQLTQRTPGSFSHVNGIADVGLRKVIVSDVQNAENLQVHVDAAGILGPGKVNISASSTDPLPSDLQIDDLAAPPAWLQDPASGALLDGTESDPFQEGLITPLQGFGSTSVDLMTDSGYIADLSSSPEPAPLGTSINLALDAPDAATLVILLVGFDQALTKTHGHKVLVALGPPTFLISLVLGPAGKLDVPAFVPNDPSLTGLEVLMQGVFVDSVGLNSISNLWLLDIG
ncbi:MAG TPA: hypothetical protein VFY71_08605 [Planctomycetota bacterium]|nr:hypothetical protein [Planctomycetota bacterium]